MDSLDFTRLANDPFVQTGVTALLGTVGTQGLLHRFPAQRLVFQFGFFLALTTLLHHHGIVPYQDGPDATLPVERVFVALAKTVWWLNGAWLAAGCARLFLFFERRPRESRLLQDLIVGLIYLGAALSVAAYVFNAPLGTLIATSGVLAIILGLALQSTLADVFSGIALNVSKAYEVGDWIVLSDGTEGRIIETNWRSTYLLDGSNDLVVLPNSSLAKTRITNVSSPNRSHGVSLSVRLMPTQAPAAIAGVMRNVLLSSNSIMAVPPPSVEIRSLDALAVEFKLSFRVADFDTAAKARHEVYDLVYRHARAAGLVLAHPPQALVATSVPAPATAQAAAPSTAAQRLLDAVPLFASLADAERSTLADAMTRKTYRKGEVLVEQGRSIGPLMVIRSGVIVVTRHSEEGELELRRLAPGDCFGGGALTGGSESGTVRALTSCVVYAIGLEALAGLLHEKPGLAEDLRAVLTRPNDSHVVNLDENTRTPAVIALMSRLRKLLNGSQSPADGAAARSAVTVLPP